jgi:FtsP/CotA-like multicopper oxidase with cupredoxin domain
MDHPAVTPPPRTVRRPPLIASGLAFLASVAVACGPTLEPGPVIPGPVTAPAAVPSASSSDTLRQPMVVRSVNGVLNATLAVVMDTLPVPIDSVNFVNWPLRSYQVWSVNNVPLADSVSAYPGPTFFVRPGDSIALKLVNDLPPSNNNVCLSYGATQGAAPIDSFPDCFHGSNWTNIHYHGFHVTPDSLGDDVLLQIQPKTSFQYAFGIPMNQSTGTHWYHPHKHGSVAVQVLNGMAGAFLIWGGALDTLTMQLKMKDQIVAVQQIDTMVNLVAGNTVKPNLVNGQYRPTIRMYPGEVQRWRIVNENVKPSKQFEIGFVDRANVSEPTMYDVARDGVQYDPSNYSITQPDTSLLTAPGNRLDVFVQAPTTLGRHLFRAIPVGNQNPRTVRANFRQLRAAQVAPADTLFYVEVVPAGTTPYNTTLPAALPALPGFLANLTPANDTVVVVFTDTTAQAPTRFYLGSNGRPYDRFNPDSVFIPTGANGDSMPMLLSQTQTWKIVNRSEQQINHPFHIHINPFQVDSVYAPFTGDPMQAFYSQLNTAQRNKPIWLDVLPLPAPTVDANGDVVIEGVAWITQQYKDFTGEFVMHCHILGHEERGMMQALEIYAPGTQPDGTTRGRPGGGHRH